jgi:anti-sigma factor RsiW
MTTPQEPHYSPAELADISALADGSLDPARRVAVQSRIDDDPRLHELFERERLAARILAQARTLDRASDELRARIERDRQARRRRPVQRPAFIAAAGVAIAAAAAVLVLVLGDGQAPGGPSVSEAAQLALRGASLPAPSPNPSNPGTQLSESVGSVHFPIYASRLDARAVGERLDVVSQRRAVTVYYAQGSRRIAYTIVGGRPLPRPSGQAAAPGFIAFRVGQRTVVTWRRGGHTCVLSASGVPLHELVALASWAPASYLS